MECKLPHTLAVQDVLSCYNVKLEEGLSSSQAQLVILLILIANAIVGVWQETNAEKALAPAGLSPGAAGRSQLTGESQSVSKELTPQEEQSVIQAKAMATSRHVNMLFASTTISNGCCVGVVTSTGMDTEIGAIQDAVQSAAEDEDRSRTQEEGWIGLVPVRNSQEQTPLQQKLDDFGNLLAKARSVHQEPGDGIAGWGVQSIVRVSQEMGLGYN
eukprot:Skav228055  [mRNA]  locus=scaffold1188:275731:280041:+ [translate_table: standard]